MPMTFPILLVLYEIANYLSNDMYLPAVPEMMHDLNLSTQQVQLTLSLWFMGLATTPLLFGAISDRFGRRPVLLWGGVIYILASVFCALATNLSSLLIARFIQGAIIPSMMVAGYASIHESFDHREAIRILAIMGSITVLAPAFGPLLGSFILQVGGWRDIFWLIAGLSTLVILALNFYMPETHDISKRHPIQLKTLLPSYKRVLTNKQYMGYIAIICCMFSGFIVWITTSPLLIIESFHYSTTAYGVFQAVIFTFYIICNHLVDFLIGKIGVTRLLQWGLWISLISGLLASALAFTFPHTVYPYVVAFTVYSMGTAFCFAPLNRLVVESSQEPMGIRVAFFTMILTLSLAITSSVAGIVYNGSIFSSAILTTILAVLAYLISLRQLKAV